MSKSKIIALIIIILILITAIPIVIYNVTKEVSDAEKFKKEYESYNNKIWRNENKAGTYIKVDIEKDNPIIYLNTNSIISQLEEGNKIVLFAYPEDNVTRIALPTLFKAAKENGIEQIYYYDIEGIEKQYKQKTNKKTVQIYEKIVEMLNSIEPKDSTTIESSTLVLFKEGEAQLKHIGTVESHTDYTRLLTNDETNELYKIYEDFMISLIMCDENC